MDVTTTRDSEEETTSRVGMLIVAIVAALLVMVFAVIRPFSDGTTAEVLNCGIVTVDSPGSPWGVLWGSVSLSDELLEQTQDGAITVRGELRDGVFHGPHGLEVDNLTASEQSGLGC